MNKKELHKMRKEYSPKPLDIYNLSPDPFTQFGFWFSEAEEQLIANPSELSEANAMVLSTATKDGIPSSRMVLLKCFSPDGFVFFTNYNSRKGEEIDENKMVSLLFFWHNSMRQVRIEGAATKISMTESDLYFNSRPRESQASSALSLQSKTLDNKQKFDSDVKHLAATGKPIKRPENWGGYVVTPHYFEFWQGGIGRSHDRIIYSIDTNSREKHWNMLRLYP